MRPWRYTQRLQSWRQRLVAQVGLVVLQGSRKLIAKLRLIEEEPQRLSAAPGLVAQQRQEQPVRFRGAIPPSQYNRMSHPAEVPVRRYLRGTLDQAGEELVGFLQPIFLEI